MRPHSLTQKVLLSADEPLAGRNLPFLRLKRSPELHKSLKPAIFHSYGASETSITLVLMVPLSSKVLGRADSADIPGPACISAWNSMTLVPACLILEAGNEVAS